MAWFKNVAWQSSADQEILAFYFSLPCEQRFLSWMAFSIYKFIRVACLFHKPTTWLTSDTNDFVQVNA